MKNDARVRYTRMRIKDAFFACLKEKPVSKITVKELCDMAEINRATFYKHYADPFDLLEKMEEEALENMRRMILESRRDSHQGLMLTILQNIEDTDGPHAVLASEHGDPNFAARISELFYQECFPRMTESMPSRTKEEQDMAYQFVAGGCGQVLSKWVQSGMQTPAEQLVEQMRVIAGAFMDAYEKLTLPKH